MYAALRSTFAAVRCWKHSSAAASGSSTISRSCALPTPACPFGPCTMPAFSAAICIAVLALSDQMAGTVRHHCTSDTLTWSPICLATLVRIKSFISRRYAAMTSMAVMPAGSGGMSSLASPARCSLKRWAKSAERNEERSISAGQPQPLTPGDTSIISPPENKATVGVLG